MVPVHCPSSYCHLSSIPFVLSKDLAQTGIHYENKWLWEDNSVKIPGYCALPFLILPSTYKPSSITITFLLFNIWPGPATKWLWGDNSINIQGMIMVFGFCPSPHCYLSIYLSHSKPEHSTTRVSSGRC